MKDIKIWMEEAKKRNATHLIVALDAFDYDNYPVYVSANENVHKKINQINWKAMQGIDEIYNMSIDIDKQLAEDRAYHI